MSIFHDSIGLPRAREWPLLSRMGLTRIATYVDEFASPARTLRAYLRQRLEMRDARRAVELSLQPRIRVHLHCKYPDGRDCVSIIL